MASAIVKKKKYTYKDYVDLDDDKRYELIKGDLLMTPSPATKHQRVLRKLAFILEKFVNENNLGETFFAPYDVYLDDSNVVQPDIMFISKDKLDIITEKNIQGAPCLIIEIVFESSAYLDMVQKKNLYASFGVKEYWIVIPEEESIEIYVLENKVYRLYKTYRKDEIVKCQNVKSLKIKLTEIF